MSGNPLYPENWQHGQDYWIYLPANLSDNFAQPTSSLNPRGRMRDPLLLLEERPARAPTDSLSRVPAAPALPSVRFVLLDDAFGSPLDVDSPPPYYRSPPRFTQPPPQNRESVLPLEDQNKALSKLRKQFYSPHISNIVKRLGTKYTTAGGGRSKTAADDYDDGKRCAVCLDDFESNKFVTVTPCDHMFHEECIVPWLKTQGKCPVCRYVMA